MCKPFLAVLILCARVGSGFPHKYKTNLKKLDSDKHSSFFDDTASDTGENKLECLSLASFHRLA